MHGVHDLHGLVWEWVEDYAAMLVSSDNRQQLDPDLLQFCGAGALSTDDRENYAVLMRIAMLSALEVLISAPTAVSWLGAGAGVRTFKLLYGDVWTAMGQSREPFAPSCECIAPAARGDWTDAFRQVITRLS